MDRHTFPLGNAALFLALASAACSDPVSMSRDLQSLPPGAGATYAPGQFGDFGPISGSAACVAPPSLLADFATYEPFVLPTGYTQRIVSTELADWQPLAGAGADLPDMMTLNETGPQAGRYLYRTHEVGSNGAVTVTDLWTGATALADQQSHYESLDGIVWTPRHTLLFAEERIVASRKDPLVPNAVGGLVYEYDPATGITPPLPAVGARSHEGLRFDAQGNLYGISESTPGVNGSGAIYKFVPDRRDDYTSGQLYALKVLDASRIGEAVWVPLDRAAVQVNSDAEAIANGATGWGRPEDIEINTNVGNTRGGQVMYVTSTSEALVLRIELDGDQAFVTNYVKEGVNVSGLQNPDNLALDNEGNLYIEEDNGPGDIWMVRAGSGPQQVAATVELFASLSDCSAESTGLYFDRNSQRAWVHVQHAGGALRNDLLVEITKR
jgi:hypothetical protein